MSGKRSIFVAFLCFILLIGLGFFPSDYGNAETNSSTSTPTSLMRGLGEGATSTPFYLDFLLGGRVFALDKIKLYEFSNFLKAPLSIEKSGSQGFVEEGPVRSDGLTWFKIDYDGGQSGWVVGNYLSKIEPPTGSSPEGEVRITSVLASRSYPKVSEDKIVWQDKRNGNYDIYLYDLTAKKERQLTSGSGDEFRPSIYGNKIVYLNRSANPENPGKDSVLVYLFNLSTGKESPLSLSSKSQSEPVIFGDKVAYVEVLSRNNRTLFIYDLLGKTKEKIAEGKDISGLNMAGDYLSWMSVKEGVWKAYAYNIKTKTPLSIPSHGGNQTNPAVSEDGKLIYGEGKSGEDWDIYLYDLLSKIEKKITAYTGPINLHRYI